MTPSRHLLIVDDEDDFRASLALLLEFEGFRVSDASSGDHAVSLVEAGLAPDVVLLDHRMPGLSGGEALVAMRGRGCRAPAVLVSAAREAPELARRHGFDGVVRKPFNADDLLAAVRAVLPAGGAAD